MLKPIEKASGKLLGKDSFVLEHGLSTGHNHVLKGKGLKVFQKGEEKLITLPTGGVLVHEEHAHLKIKAGSYLFIKQREFDLLEGIRKVSD